MSENTTSNRNVRDDEIDLLDLFNRMGRAISRGFKALWKAFLISIVFMVRRWLPLLISIILGFGVSYIMMKTSTSLYSTDLVLKNNAIPNDQLISYINRLQTFGRSSLSKILDIPEETGQNIAFISAYWIIDKNKDKIPDFVDYANSHDIYDTTDVRMTDRVNISIKIITPQNLDAVRDGLKRYIEANSEFVKMNQLRLDHKKELLERMNIDIQDIDSLQKVEFFEKARESKSKNGNQIIVMQAQPNIQLFYRDIHNLYKSKQLLEDDLGLNRELVSVINDFSPATTRVNGFSFYLKKNVPGLFLAMLILLVIVANFKKLKEVYQKY